MISSDKLSFIGILWSMTVSINGNDFKRCKKETEMGRATENGLSEFLQHFLLPL